jgi:hypothetical protein
LQTFQLIGFSITFRQPLKIKLTIVNRIFFAFLFFACCLSVSTSYAVNNYFFTGSGDWTDASNWLNGIRPPSDLTADDSVLVIGTAVIPNCSTCQGNLIANSGGVIRIYKEGSLTFQNAAKFSLYSGNIFVEGTMSNETTFEMYNGSSITVVGTLENKSWLNNQGLIQVWALGTFNNRAGGTLNLETVPAPPMPGQGLLYIDNLGTFNNFGTIKMQPGTVINNSNGVFKSIYHLDGNATFVGSLVNEGTLAPGYSPGIYALGGDYTATSTAVHEFEVGGTATEDYDRLNSARDVYLDGTLNVTLINGFVPSASDSDIVVVKGTIHGTFATVNKPSQYYLVYNSNSVVLRVASTLPVTFSNIDVQKDGNGLRLVWHMQSESNVFRYEVERSSNGRDFKKVGTVNPANSGNYSFTDPVPGVGTTYYRIKSVDRDGKFSHSIVVTYKQGKSAIALSVFPSPAKGVIHIQHTPTTSSHKITLTTVDGRILQTIIPAIGSQKTLMNGSHLRRGLYFVHLYKGAEKIETIRFIKE